MKVRPFRLYEAMGITGTPVTQNASSAGKDSVAGAFSGKAEATGPEGWKQKTDRQKVVHPMKGDAGKKFKSSFKKGSGKSRLRKLGAIIGNQLKQQA